jgi:hypothetical protein
MHAQKRPWNLATFSYLSNSAKAAWMSACAGFQAHESVGRLNLDFQAAAKMFKKIGTVHMAFEQLPKNREHYFQVCSSKIMRSMLPNW